MRFQWPRYPFRRFTQSFSSEYISEDFCFLVAVGSAISRLEIYYQRVKLTRNGVYYTVFDYSNVDTTMYQ